MGLINALIKTATLPIEVVKDVVEVATGGEVEDIEDELFNP